MKNISDPSDDWMNGSWTVDCICGVNFDDGDEMVNCDECGVWVHTRCSRFVREEKSFSCDKCKNKATRKNRPIEQRVHVQGIPGGDPSVLFQGLSSVFSSELWKCTGYVPKKFNFCYREFPIPCLDKQHEIRPKNEDETANSVDKGGDSKDISVQKLMKNEKRRPMVLKIAKRSREDLIPSKDQNGTKKTKLVHKENGRKREKVHACKTDVTCATSTRQVKVLCDGKALKDIKANASDNKHGSEKDVGLHDMATNALLNGISDIEKPKSYAANDERNLGPMSSKVCGLGYSTEKRIKTEEVNQDAPEQVRHKCAKTESVPLPSSENDAIGNTFVKKEVCMPMLGLALR